MAINFPNNPTSGQTYTYNSITWSWNGTAWEKTSTAIGNYVSFLNGLTGGVTLAQGSNITLTPSGNTITIASSGGGGGPVGDYVATFNGLTGAVTGVTTSVANIFTALNTFNAGISASGATFGNGPVTIAGYTAWHAGNDGATSALDAGLLYGVQGNIYASSLSTGLLYGGLLSINAGNTATFDVSAGAGYIVTTGATFTAEPNPVITRVTWTAKTGVTLAGLTAQDTTWLYFDSTGALKQQASFYTDDQINSTIAVGALVHPTRSYISLAKTIPNVSYATDKQYEQFIRSFGPLKVSGHTIQANDGNMRLNRTSGTAFILGRNYPNDPNNPSVVSDIAKTDAEIWRYYRGITAGTWTTVTGITTGLDPTKYDADNGSGGGVLTSVSPSTPFTIQRVFFFPNTPNVLGVYYGRGQYASLSEAANNIHLEDFTEITNTATNAVLAAFIIVKYNTTNLTTAIAADNARIIQAGQFRTTSSGGGSVATNLDSLSDVIITSVQDDDLLIYDTTTSQWLNTPLQHIGVSRFNGLTGAVTGVTAINAGTGISISGTTNPTITNTGVQTWNGSTGTVTFNNYVSSFNGTTGVITGVSRFNGLTGGVTLAAGSNITLTPSGNTVTVAASGTIFDTTVDFSEYINKISCTICGDGLDFGLSPKYFNNYTFGGTQIGTDTFDTYDVTFTTEKVYYTGSQWCADLRLTLTNDLNSVEDIVNQVINSFNTTPVEIGISDTWIPSSATLNHTEATYVTKTITGKSWVTANSFINCKIVGVTSADHTVEDALLDGVQFDINNIVPGVGFDIVGHAPNGTYGKYGVRCFGY